MCSRPDAAAAPTQLGGGDTAAALRHARSSVGCARSRGRTGGRQRAALRRSRCAAAAHPCAAGQARRVRSARATARAMGGAPAAATGPTPARQMHCSGTSPCGGPTRRAHRRPRVAARAHRTHPSPPLPARSSPPRRAPLDNEYLVGLVLQHRRHLAVAAACLLLCTASNLAAPVLSGMLFETLVQRQPMERYAQVRGGTAGWPLGWVGGQRGSRWAGAAGPGRLTAGRAPQPAAERAPPPWSAHGWPAGVLRAAGRLRAGAASYQSVHDQHDRAGREGVCLCMRVWICGKE